MSLTPTFHALLIDEITDLYFAENKLLKALPRMAKVADHPALKAGFTHHVAQTKVHVKRLAQALKSLGCPPKGKTCHAMLGRIKEVGEAIKLKGPAAVCDAALIGAAQRIEHHEMAGCGTARAFAKTRGQTKIAKLLQTTLDEEGEADRALAPISLTVNADALTGDERISPTRMIQK